MCGGTGTLQPSHDPVTGLSPRVRGNRDQQFHLISSKGSIPTCAGEPLRRNGAAQPTRVYPRVCGGTSMVKARDNSKTGLSPRVRGNRKAVVIVRIRRGSIPACAGEPMPLSVAIRRSRVYPRVCGGTSISTSSTSQISGLSPRVRGNHSRNTRLSSRFGSIPACAGEPRSLNGGTPFLGVYPRVCGGTHAGRWRSPIMPGLSPRVRGNHRPVSPVQPQSGSIPACAGEPRVFPARRILRRVYPRVCGGTSRAICFRPFSWGLSPRVRGNPSRPPISSRSRGSIPACAGEPEAERKVATLE